MKALTFFLLLAIVHVESSKVLIHVPVKVKHHHHTHTVFKHVHHSVPVHHEDIHVIHDHHDHHHHHDVHDDYRDYRDNLELLGNIGGTAGVIDVSSLGKEHYESLLMNQKRAEQPKKFYGPPKKYQNRYKRKPKMQESRNRQGVWMGYDAHNKPFTPTDYPLPTRSLMRNLDFNYSYS